MLAVSSICRKIIGISVYLGGKTSYISIMVSSVYSLHSHMLSRDQIFHLQRMECSLLLLVVSFFALSRTSRIHRCNDGYPCLFSDYNRNSSIYVLSILSPIDFYHSHFIIACQVLNDPLS